MTHRIGVIGSGSWGTALAVHLAHTGHDVRLVGARCGAGVRHGGVARESHLSAGDRRCRRRCRRRRTSQVALDGAQFVVIAVPSHGVRDVARAGQPASAARLRDRQRHEGTRRRLAAAHVAGAARRSCRTPATIVVLSGPSFASELARKLPTAMVAAGESPAVVESVMAHFRSPALRLYGSSDVVGVELGGALKNIIAIAAGVVEGLGLGHNALAALITRGLAELSRLAVALGAQRDTLAGPGRPRRSRADVHRRPRAATAGSASRWRKGQSLQDILAGTRMVAEGVRTTEAALALERAATASSCRSRARCRTCWPAAPIRRPRSAT